MTAVTNGVPWDVVSSLHTCLAASLPGTELHEVADLSIDLVLQPGRRSGNSPYSSYNLQKNARFSVRRSRARQAMWQERLKTAVQSGQYATVDHASPEEICVARELESAIRRRVVCHGPNYVRCLDGMLTGEEVAETARACGMSPRSIDRMRDHIRGIARPILLPEVAA